jgi:hypothetical protein
MNTRTHACLFSIITIFSLSAQASEFALSEVGLRAGIDSEQSIELSSYEVFGLFETPWDWAITDKLHADLQIEAAAGVLTGTGNTAAYCHLGPVLSVSYGNCPLSLTLSSGPTVLSEDTFGDKDIGGNFQFTSGIGLNWQASERWSIGYRLQHTSNASIDYPNPGLDMHTLSLSVAY